ncbi:MAG TPA: aminoacyl--tRNA ligase-related protein [Candidatus Paceibacterota bacterium]|nr:aminoacyl--tRNA ligase-related protein [Candidatus Paceibacterota bacterium]
MRLSQLFTKTLREAPADEIAVNSQYLTRGGFVFKNSAGIYSFLPLGWRVMGRIANMVREEINAIGGQELFMPALVEKKYMEPTARWDLDVGFFAKGKNDEEANFVMGWSHEEVLTAIAAKYINSYKDLPFAAYQIQTKFRNEPRAKSGLLRGREFMMKDLYSFHVSEKDLELYYEKVKDAYFRIFERCGLKAVYTLAAGGVFTDKFTHEFQVLSEVGEDTIFLCLKCGYAENLEISKLKNADVCPKCGGNIAEKKAIEVGNIFNNGTRYSDNLGLSFVDEKGVKNSVWMAAYGIGISRLMATIVEVSNDGQGIIWPESVAPYKVHLIVLDDRKEEADKIYNDLAVKGVEVLYDDRSDKTAGEKFADADLIGCPVRVVVSNKTLDKGSVEIKRRKEKDVELVPMNNIEI